MKLVIASDHAGFELKNHLIRLLKNSGYNIEDYGPSSDSSVDYPDTISPAAKAVSSRKADKGIVVCGSGIGASIVANKIRGVRAALCNDLFDAEYSRLHNNANVIALPARKLSEEKASEILIKWLSTDFEGGRHQTRIDKITKIEEEERKY